MTIYYQHIGEVMWERDAPRSIGTAKTGVVRFSFRDIEPFLPELDALERLAIQSKISDLAPTGFQVWGIPSGAQQVLEHMDTGDFLLLAESIDFAYAGQVIHRIGGHCWHLSEHIWGEERFPIVILLQGELISYPWTEFRDHFGYAPNYRMRGLTYRVSATSVASSPSKTEEAFIAGLLTTVGRNPVDLEQDFRAFANNLEVHFRLVKQRARQQEFRRSVLEAQGRCCAVCDLEIPEVLDAAHVVDKEHEGTDDRRNGITLCVLHHRMFDVGLFSIEPTTLGLLPIQPFTLADLRISRADISHLRTTPHREALRWRWERRLARIG